MRDKNDNRKFPRILKAYFTAAKWYEPDGEPWLADVGRTVNVSEGGMLLEVTQAPPFMSTLMLNLGFDDEIIKIEGEVIRLRKNDDGKIEMGIKFLNLSEDNRKIIKDSLSLASS